VTSTLPAGSDVGGDEDRHASALEREHDAVTRALRHVAVQGTDVHATVAQRAKQLLAADLGAYEDDRLLAFGFAFRPHLGAQHLDELVGLVLRLDRELELRDGVDRQRRRLDLDDLGVVHVAVGQLADRRWHRRAEQGGLAAGGRQREDFLDVLEEAEVEHLVGLVEHQEAAVVQHQRVTRDQVEHPADGAHHDVPAGA